MPIRTGYQPPAHRLHGLGVELGAPRPKQANHIGLVKGMFSNGVLLRWLLAMLEAGRQLRFGIVGGGLGRHIDGCGAIWDLDVKSKGNVWRCEVKRQRLAGFLSLFPRNPGVCSVRFLFGSLCFRGSSSGLFFCRKESPEH